MVSQNLLFSLLLSIFFHISEFLPVTLVFKNFQNKIHGNKILVIPGDFRGFVLLHNFPSFLRKSTQVWLSFSLPDFMEQGKWKLKELGLALNPCIDFNFKSLIVQGVVCYNFNKTSVILMMKMDQGEVSCCLHEVQLRPVLKCSEFYDGHYKRMFPIWNSKVCRQFSVLLLRQVCIQWVL